MTRKKIRNLLLLTFLALYFINFHLVFLWLMVGTLVLFHTEGEGVVRKKHFSNEITNIEKSYKIKVPRNFNIRQKVRHLQWLYRSSIEKNPHLTESYDDVMGDLWLSLGKEQSKDVWNQLLTKVIREWPHDNSETVFQRVEQRLGKLRQEKQRWSDSKREVLEKI